MKRRLPPALDNERRASSNDIVEISTVAGANGHRDAFAWQYDRHIDMYVV